MQKIKINTSPTLFSPTQDKYWGLFFIALYVVIGAWTLGKQYLILDSLTWLALLLLPYLFFIRKVEKENFNKYKYLLISILCLIISIIIPLGTLYFLALGFGLLFVTESLFGKLNLLPIGGLFIISPAFKYFGVSFGFPIRLKLSELAGNLLQQLGYKAEVFGNIIRLNGTDFSIDPACVGLQMLMVSCLIGLVIMAFFERKTQQTLSFPASILLFTAIILLNIFSNLVRIILLVLFKILPENPLHDMLGLACLAFYVILPSYLLIAFTFSRLQNLAFHNIFLWRVLPFSWLNSLFSSNRFSVKKNTHQYYSKILIINTLLLLILIIQGYFFRQSAPLTTAQAQNYQLSGFRKEILKNGIVKLENTESLVYLKPLAGFYSAEHSPLICWQGSGYEFSKTETKKIGKIEVYWGILTKENDKIYTAWWFDNGTFRTIDPMAWRWEMLKNKKEFSLINVNATSETKLYESVQKIIAP